MLLPHKNFKLEYIKFFIGNIKGVFNGSKTANSVPSRSLRNLKVLIEVPIITTFVKYMDDRFVMITMINTVLTDKNKVIISILRGGNHKSSVDSLSFRNV